MRKAKHPLSKSAGTPPLRIYTVTVGNRLYEAVLAPSGEARSVRQRFRPRGRAVIWNSFHDPLVPEGEVAEVVATAREMQKAEAAP